MKEPDFDLSADMRLLELQRGALGLPARERTGWETSSPGATGLPVASHPGEEPEVSGALLAVETNAFPKDGVIPGAVVTLTMTIANEGGGPATDVVASAPLPGGASFRPGSFAWNGRSCFDDVADAFFGEGLRIGAIGASERATFEWKVGVKLGTKPLLVAPAVRAAGAAVVGARPLSIGRKPTGGGGFSTALERADAAAANKPLIPVDLPVADLPIYELDEEEAIVAEAAQAALSTTLPEVPLVETVQELATPEPEPEPETAPATPSDAIVLYGRFDRTSVAFFERVFSGTKTPTILDHCILGGALACSVTANGDRAGLKAHLDAQAQVLHRISLHEKLGKKEPISGYAGELLARLDGLAPANAPAPAESAGALLLSTALPSATVTLLRRIGDDPERWDFVRARQLTLALQADAATASHVTREVRDDIAAALRAYAQASVAVLQKLFVRMRIDRTTGMLLAGDVALDASARALIETFKRALP